MAVATREKWAELVSRWARSGLTAKRFAEKTGINAGTLQYYKWRLGREARSAQQEKASAIPKVGFVEVRAADLAGAERSGASGGLEVVFASGTRVVVPPDFDAETFRKVIRVLGEAR